MKYLVAVLALVAGVWAMPQEASSVTAAPASVVSPSLRPQESCIFKCDPRDVTCKAACVGVARPNESQIGDTNECARKCDQGDGSKAATDRFAKCQQDCFASYFPSTQTAGNLVNGPAQTAAGVAASATDSAGALISQATSGASAPTSSLASAAAAAPSETPGAANSHNVRIAAAGIAGLAVAIFAL